MVLDFSVHKYMILFYQGTQSYKQYGLKCCNKLRGSLSFHAHRHCVTYAGNVDLNMRDEACEVPKPLVVAIEELGDIARPTVKILRQHGAEGGTNFPGDSYCDTTMR